MLFVFFFALIKLGRYFLLPLPKMLLGLSEPLLDDSGLIVLISALFLIYLHSYAICCCRLPTVLLMSGLYLKSSLSLLLVISSAESSPSNLVVYTFSLLSSHPAAVSLRNSKSRLFDGGPKMSSTSLIFRRYWSWLVWSLRAFPRHSGSSTSGPPPPMRIY